MVVGDKFTFIIPSDLAYGSSGIPQLVLDQMQYLKLNC